MESTSTDWLTARKEIVGNALSIGLAVAMYGVSFGALGTTTGLTVLQTMALSLLMFTGASQFTLVSTLASGGTALTAVVASWLMGTRNAAYSMRMTAILKTKGVSRIVAVQLTIDESTAMGLAQDETSFEGRASRLAFWATGLSVYLLWNLATFIGAVSATAIGDPKAFGLDAAIAAGLFALVWPQIKSRIEITAALGGALIALTLTPFVSPGIPVLAAALVAIIIGWTTGRKFL
ncbi:MAG: AzlC family ABC transporter permease [Actinomycetes bacterium]